MVMSIYEARQQHMLPGVKNAIYSSSRRLPLAYDLCDNAVGHHYAV
jgi:hypothetical protein